MAQMLLLYLSDYTRSPEAKYPIPLEEAYAATKWIAENGQTLNLDSSRLVVAGDSVGGNMATVVASTCQRTWWTSYYLPIIILSSYRCKF